MADKKLTNRKWEEINLEDDKGALGSAISIDIDIAVADTYEKITSVAGGDYVDTTAVCNNFTVNTDGSLTLTGETGFFELKGSSDLSVDSACTTRHALFVNDALYIGPDGKTFETPHTFTQIAKISSISVVGIAYLETGDKVEVYTKSTVTNTITVSGLSVLLKRW